MSDPRQVDARLPSAYLAPGSSSFAEFLSRQAPELLPGNRSMPPGGAADLAPHGTTIVATTFNGGVVMAGDRRATMGNVIAQRDMEKVFPADEYSAVGIAGSAGLAVEMVRLFQTELEHYEKIEGTTLSMDGKANRLAALILDGLPAGHRRLLEAGCGEGLVASAVQRVARTRGIDVAYTGTDLSAAAVARRCSSTSCTINPRATASMNASPSRWTRGSRNPSSRPASSWPLGTTSSALNAAPMAMMEVGVPLK